MGVIVFFFFGGGIRMASDHSCFSLRIITDEGEGMHTPPSTRTNLDEGSLCPCLQYTLPQRRTKEFGGSLCW